MQALVLHEYGGPEKLRFEDNVPEPQVGGRTCQRPPCWPLLPRAALLF
jgi:hypothetical protein